MIIKCEYCGQGNPQEWECRKCGAPLPTREPPIHTVYGEGGLNLKFQDHEGNPITQYEYEQAGMEGRAPEFEAYKKMMELARR